MIELGVDQCCVERAVAKNIGYLFEGTSLIEQPTSERMTQRMRAPVGESDPPVRVADYTPHGIDTDGLITWSETTHENGSVTGLGPFVAQVRRKCPPGACRQRQDILPTRLRAPESDRAGPPVDVSELKMSHFAAAEAEIEGAAYNRQPPSWSRQGDGKGLQQPIDLARGQCARQRGETPVSR